MQQHIPFRHPLARYAAGTVLGRRRNGSPIYAIAGGSGEGEGGSGSGSGGTGDGGTGAGGQGAAGGQGSGQQGGQASPWEGFQWDGNVDSLPADVAKVIRDARADAGKARTTAKEQAAKEAREALLKQLSGDAAEPLTPEQLQQQLSEARTAAEKATAEALAARIEQSVYRTAQRLGANADALLDSRSFVDAVDALDVDPTDTKAFTAAVEAKVTEAMQANPALRAPRGPGRSGGDMGGAGGSGDQAASLDKQIEEATQRRDFATVIRLKRQRAAQNT